GTQFQTYEFIALGVGGAFAIASGVMFYFGYFADEPAPARMSHVEPTKLRILPYVTGEGGGGLSAAFRF
ncbi:MAG TPA: hypothetical protein VGG33_21085, partial [Polyangia bacterium]